MTPPEWKLAVALAVGLIVGVERERRKADRPGFAGVRSFALAGMLGGVLEFFSNAVGVWIGAGFIALLTIASYLRSPDEEDRGITTEVAFFLTYVLGALAIDRPLHALAIAVTATTVLALRTAMHDAVRRLLTDQELLDGLTLAVCALVVLPLLPNRAIDPWGVANPFVLWRLVVIVTAITAAGYVAQRAVGPRYGLTAAGFASGFVSSAATVAAMGQRSRAEPRVEHAAVAGAAASTVATFAQAAILVGAADARVLARLALALGLGGGASLLYALNEARIAAEKVEAEASTGRAFSLRAAALFAIVVAAVSLVAALLESRLGIAGVLVGAAIAGFADAHAISASLASLAAGGALPPESAALGVMLALTTNTVTKALLARSSGTTRYVGRVAVGLLFALGGAWLGYFVVRVV